MVYTIHHTFLYWGLLQLRTLLLPFLLLLLLLVVVVFSNSSHGPACFRGFQKYIKMLRHCRSSTQKYAASQLCSDTRIQNLSVGIQ
jgi:hypothetical protein